MHFSFTLVELLAVIVLLGLVAVIAFPRILESMDKTNKKFDDSQLKLLYQGAARYLKKEENAYPKLEGNTFCIKPSKLEEENYIRYERKDDNEDYVVRAVITENDKISYSYVNKYECIEKGVVVANLGKVKCEVEESGYAVSKVVKIQYPVGEDYVYSYSFDGENWNTYKDEDGSGLQEIEFQSGGMVIARVRRADGGSGYQSCTTRVSQIDSEEVGSIIAYTGEEIPKGYILADGKAVSRKAYYNLYKVIGTMYGSGDGATTFNLPNVEGRVIVGQSKTGSYSGIGTTGGEITHSLTKEEMPSHTHEFTGSNVTSGNNSATLSATFTGNSVTTSTIANHTHSIPALSGTAATNGAHSHSLGSGIHFITGNASNLSRRKVYGGTGKNRGYAWTTDSTTIYDDISASTGLDGGIAGATQAVRLVHSHTVTTNASTSGEAGGHSHTVTSSGTVTLSNITHTHSVTAKGTNSNAGGDKGYNNLMPYNTLKYIVKYQ